MWPGFDRFCCLALPGETVLTRELAPRGARPGDGHLGPYRTAPIREFASPSANRCGLILVHRRGLASPVRSLPHMLTEASWPPSSARRPSIAPEYRSPFRETRSRSAFRLNPLRGPAPRPKPAACAAGDVDTGNAR